MKTLLLLTPIKSTKSLCIKSIILTQKYSTPSIKYPELPEPTALKQEIQSLSTFTKNYRDVLIKDNIIEYFDTKFCNKIDLKGKIVIELYPGPGILTRSILKKQPKGIIPIDPVNSFKDQMEKLEKCANIPIEHENYFNISALNAENILQDKLAPELQKLPRTTHSYENFHPDLVMLGTINDEWKSTQLINLIIESCYNKEGWFKFGRFPIYLFLHQVSLKKLGKGQKVPWALTTLFDVYLEGLDGPKFEVQPKNFNEENISLIPNDSWLFQPGRRKVGVLKLIPHKEPKIKAPLYIFTHILFLFGQSKSSKLKTAIKTLDPGSESVLKLVPQIDPNTKCKDLTLEELDAISLGYFNWYKKSFGKEPKRPQYIV